MARKAKPSNVTQGIGRSPTQRSILHMWGKDEKIHKSLHEGTKETTVGNAIDRFQDSEELGGAVSTSTDVGLCKYRQRGQQGDERKDKSEIGHEIPLGEADAILLGNRREAREFQPESNRLKRNVPAFERHRANDDNEKCSGLHETTGNLPREPLCTLYSGGRTGSVRLQEDCGTSDRPIVIGSSPINRSRATVGRLPTVEANRKCNHLEQSKRKIEEANPKWPDSERQHTRGPQKVFHHAVSNLPCRIYHSSTPDLHKGSVASQALPLRRQIHRAQTHVDEPTCEQFDSNYSRIEAIVQQNPKCRAISRFQTAECNIPGIAWIDRWRPRSADEVLGNESLACYLRDWLLALELKAGHAVSKPEEEPVANSLKHRRRYLSKNLGYTKTKVIRSVERPRKKRRKASSDESCLSDWITDDEVWEGENDSDEDLRNEDNVLPCSLHGEFEEKSLDNDSENAWSPRRTRLVHKCPTEGNSFTLMENMQARTSPLHDFSDRLTNTILLAGPTGSGKTAAVYACAEELGWEVFEVYPGIGKRNGASLISLVGDVSRNHVVRTTANRNRNGPIKLQIDKLKIDTSDSYTEKCQTGLDKPINRNAELEAISDNRQIGSRLSTSDLTLDDKVDSRKDHEFLDETNRPCLTENIAQQSVILLEEVDVLFNEDANFWPTVVALIRDSRRPVIMTCNDHRLVPIYDLPLQTTLFFTPCSSELAAAYLQCLSLTEGHSISNEGLKTLYENRPSVDDIDLFVNIMHGTTKDVLPASDLRRAINCLQFVCESKSALKGHIAPMAFALEHELRPESCFDTPDSLLCRSDLCTASSINSQKTSKTSAEDKGANTVDRLWRSAEAISAIDNMLDYDLLKPTEFDSEKSSDDQLGYYRPMCGPSIKHLQGGNVLCNKDRMMAEEMLFLLRTTVCSDHSYTRLEEDYASRAEELIRTRRSCNARVVRVLEEILSTVATESTATMMLEYEPWVRFIDQADSALEVELAKESDARSARGGRSTRNSQRMRYERYLNLDEGHRREWWEGALHFDHVGDTLSST